MLVFRLVQTEVSLLKSFYIIHMASPPKLGKCHVKPTKGIFLKDAFSVKCSGFSSESKPLTYIFYMDPGNDTTNAHGENGVYAY